MIITKKNLTIILIIINFFEYSLTLEVFLFDFFLLFFEAAVGRQIEKALYT